MTLNLKHLDAVYDLFLDGVINLDDACRILPEGADRLRASWKARHSPGGNPRRPSGKTVERENPTPTETPRTKGVKMTQDEALAWLAESLHDESGSWAASARIASWRDGQGIHLVVGDLQGEFAGAHLFIDVTVLNPKTTKEVVEGESHQRDD